MQIQVHTPFTFNDKDGVETFYARGIHEVLEEVATHNWTALHSEIISFQEFVQEEVKKEIKEVKKKAKEVQEFLQENQ